jgi:hypothetical protein
VGIGWAFCFLGLVGLGWQGVRIGVTRFQG